MPRITKAEYEAYQIRHASIGQIPKEGVELEGTLHQDIIKYCRAAPPHGWMFFHGAMCEPTHRTGGEPDFLIFAPWGYLLVECKSRTGKLSTAQASVKYHLETMGHPVYIVHCMREFLEAIETAKTLNNLRSGQVPPCPDITTIPVVRPKQ